MRCWRSSAAFEREYDIFWSILQDLFDNLSQSVKITQFYGFREPITAQGRGRTSGPAGGVSAAWEAVAPAGDCAESAGGECQCAALPFDTERCRNSVWERASTHSSQMALSGGAVRGEETLTLIGPRSRVISNLRILGPCRTLNQVELAYTDGLRWGLNCR